MDKSVVNDLPYSRLPCYWLAGRHGDLGWFASFWSSVASVPNGFALGGLCLLSRSAPDRVDCGLDWDRTDSNPVGIGFLSDIMLLSHRCDWVRMRIFMLRTVLSFLASVRFGGSSFFDSRSPGV
jgi:hypothetical protein